MMIDAISLVLYINFEAAMNDTSRTSAWSTYPHVIMMTIPASSGAANLIVRQRAALLHVCPDTIYYTESPPPF
jgi:hypothetical protein